MSETGGNRPRSASAESGQFHIRGLHGNICHRPTAPRIQKNLPGGQGSATADAS
jgi:hypothetical protein